MKKRKDINLIVPRSWNELSSEQLEQLSGLAVQRNVAQQMGQDVELSEREYRLQCFLTLAGLRKECRTEWVDGEAVYWFPLRRSTWWKRWFARPIYVPIRAWQMKEWVDKYLSWLDEPYGRLRAPYVDVKVRGGKTLRCLGDRMTDCTYRQYISLENIMKQYWEVQQLAQRMTERMREVGEGIMPALANQMRNLDELRRMFMATMLSPSSRIVQEQRNGMTVACEKVTFQFDEAQIEEVKDRFTRRQVDRMFPVLLQFYLSTQKYFSTLYPNLYVQRDGDEKEEHRMPDFVRLEIESMSTIMKYQGFADYRTIYDSDAVHILRVLDNMARESKEMKKMKAPH